MNFGVKLDQLVNDGILNLERIVDWLRWEQGNEFIESDEIDKRHMLL